MEVKEGEAMAEKCIIVFSSVVFQTCACLHVLTVALYICEGSVPLALLDGSSRRFCFVHMGMPSHPSSSVCAMGVAALPIPFAHAWDYDC